MDDYQQDWKKEYLYQLRQKAQEVGLCQCDECYQWFDRIEMHGPYYDDDYEYYLCPDCAEKHGGRG